MSFFSKNKNTQNNTTKNINSGNNSQRVALRTMQQDLASAKELDAEVASVKIASIENHRGNQGTENNKPTQKNPVSAQPPQKENPDLASFNAKAPSAPPAPQPLGDSQPHSQALPAAPSAQGENKTEHSDKKSPNSFPIQKPVPPINYSVPEQKSKLSPAIKKIIPVAVGVFSVVIIATGVYFIMGNKKDNSAQNMGNDNPSIEHPVENPKIIENNFKLLEFENTYDLDIDFDTFNDHNGNIQTILADKISSKELEIPANGFVDIQISINGEFPDSNRLIKGALKDFPESILSKIGEKCNLFAYMQGNSSRLGFIAEVPDKQGLVSLIREQENILPKILKGLYFDKTIIGKAASDNFNEAEYKEAIIRYKNFPVHSSAIEYGIIDNALIFTTSKDSMYEMVDYVSKFENKIQKDNAQAFQKTEDSVKETKEY